MAYTEEQKTIYVPKSKNDTWNEIEKAAKSEHHGVGTYLCLLWEKIKVKGVKL